MSTLQLIVDQVALNFWLPLGHMPVPAEVALKAAVIVGMSAGLTRLLRSRSAALRHDVWLAALALLLVVVALPGAAAALRSQPIQSAAAAATLGVQQREPQETRNDRKKSIELALQVVWLLGVTVCTARFVGGVVLLRNWSQRARPVVDPAWTEDAGRACAAAGLRVPLGLVWSEHVAVPMIWGRRRPILFLPEAAANWSPDCRRAVLRHEIAHVTRNDMLVEIVVQLVVALLWFHPCVWFAARKLRLERERACDDVTLALIRRPLDYAQHLFAIADAARGRGMVPSLAQHAVSRGALESRIASLLDPAVQHTLPSGRLRGAAMALSALVGTPILVISPVAYAAAHGCTASAAFLSAPARLFF